MSKTPRCSTPAPGSPTAHVVTAGGRVLCVCALGDTVADAQRKAYAEVAGISWHGEFHRHDIGWRAIARERRASEGRAPE